MFETLDHLLQRAGPKAKAVVWAHDFHIGDARHTEMGKVRGELNIGQLCREKYGDATALIGLGTHSGTVAAATDWINLSGPRWRRASTAAAVFRENGVSFSISPASPTLPKRFRRALGALHRRHLPAGE
ncbi:erythromycin esterase family protein [Rhizobium sp. TRM96647]|jgi:hypothetical protein|nr:MULTISPECIES: erythromycin esterase family protein [unclassified Rhizobium]MCV3738613.1 erythromycin esterase family protein [Rhizobium sp. TRM96647]MCV3760300.1 erythromycin esterase family protein [Rhizobium sp. TRM96650]